MADDPLSSKEAMAAFIQKARAAGKTDDQIRSFVAMKRGEFPAGLRQQTYPFEQVPPAESGFKQVAPGRVVYRPEAVPLNSEESKQQDIQNALGMAKGLGTAAMTATGMELAPMLVPAAVVKARPIVGAALKAGARALGAGAGQEAGAALSGEKPSLSRGLKTARNVALVEGAIRTPAYMFARTGGVEPAAAAMAQDRPELLQKAPASEYASAAKDIAETKVPPTAEHFGYNMLVRAKGDIDGMRYVDRILKTVRPNVDEPMARLIERKTGSLADSLFQRLGPDGKISAEALDDWLRVNVSEPAARVYEKGAGTAWQERLASLRDDLQPQLYKDVGAPAAEFQRAASAKIGKEQAARTAFPASTEGKMNLQTPGYLRQILKDNDLGHEVRTRLAGLDEVAGTHNLQRVEDLAMRSSWTAAEKAEVEDILANVPAIAYERVGLVRAAARKVGRGLTRAARPAGRVAAVGSTIRGVSQ